MNETTTQIKTFIGSLKARFDSLRGSIGASRTRIWAASYWPILAGVLVALPFVFMPEWTGMSRWTYLITAPIGIGAGFIGYGAAFLAMDE